ncbi:MAG: 2OG-Fe(II) oxygenase family protein, partial [Rhodospirillaceae bacterium]
WVDVIPPANAFILNIGDMMKMWTNDRWCSNAHRVANPPIPEGGSGARLSIAFFTYPNPDAVIECIPTCRAAGETPRHSPVLSGDYRRMKVASTTAAAQTVSAN